MRGMKIICKPGELAGLVLPLTVIRKLEKTTEGKRDEFWFGGIIQGHMVGIFQKRDLNPGVFGSEGA